MKRIYALLSLVLAGSGLLYSFQQSKKQEDPKKRYQLILVQDGNVIEKDTVLATDDSFSPEDFARLHGYKGDSIDVIQMHQEFIEINRAQDLQWEADLEQEMESMGAEIQVLIEEMMENLELEDAQSEDIHIEIQEKDGKTTIKKTVNGQEIEVSKDEGDEIIQSFIIKMASLEDSIAILEEDVAELERKIIKKVEIRMDSVERLSSEMERDAIFMIQKEIEMGKGEGKEAHIEILRNGVNPTENHAIVIVETIAEKKSEKITSSTNATNALKLFPNPIQNDLNIRGKLPSGKINIKVIDLQGKVIYRDQVKIQEGSSSIKIDAKHWPKGNYEIIIEGKNFKQVEQIIKA